MAANPYELRWELLQRAEDRLIQRYNSLENRFNILNERGEDPGEFPEYPTDYDILALAKQMNSFISGDE
jgi:hypothetical protein